MRWDQTGIFWDDYVPPKVPVVKEKREPPEPIWLKDDYLPGLEEAKAYEFQYISDNELVDLAKARTRLVWDTEFYNNFSLIGFGDPKTRKVVKFEFGAGEQLLSVEREKLIWILRNFTVVGFNDTAFDIPMVMASLEGFSTEKLMQCVNDLIFGEFGIGFRPFIFYRKHKIKPLVVDNIDLIELTPLSPGLKICAGRMFAERMADLPFAPGTNLSEDQKTILRYYWVNDLDNTARLLGVHSTALNLREILSKEYSTDVRSKSDPQIAEAVLRAEITRITGRRRFERAEIEDGRRFRYVPPKYVQYKSENMKWVLDFIKRQWFVVDAQGSPTMPKDLAGMDIPIGGATYRIGIGGLHSQEKKAQHFSDEQYELSDNDVVSYYPSLMIQQAMFPPNIGPVFIQVFERIYHRRIAAKKSGDKATAETLKIVLNGTFGKTGERGGHSVVYYPEMMIQVTLTGQLSLLMLIEALELAGISVVSANTDGIMIKCRRDMLDVKNEILDWWQKATGLELESKNYKAVYSRDVNNYVAIYEKPDEKEKGVWKYAKAIGAYRKTIDVYPLKWNPTCEVCSEAVIAFLALGTPVDETIRKCDDIRKFIEVRRVNGGAFKDGEYLGKAIRWYYSTEAGGPIINAKNGNYVPRSKGARPCMILPKVIPVDLDWDYYVQRANDTLELLLQEKVTHD